MKPNKNIAVFAIHDVKAIIFDKDGTILDFYHTWRPIWDKVIDEITKAFKLKSNEVEEICTILGVTETGFTPDSIFVKDNYSTIMQTVFDKSTLDEETKNGIYSYVSGFIQEMAHLHTKAHVFDGVIDTLKVLKEQGFILGLMTSDLESIALKHLEEAEVAKLFDYIACDDGEMKVKPHPDMLHAFCNKFDLEPFEIAMVGDSIIDMQFAIQNDMGYAVYVRSGYPDVKAEKMADMILESTNQLILSNN